MGCLASFLSQVDSDCFRVASESLLSKAEEDSKNSDYLPIVEELVHCLFSPEFITDSSKADSLQQVS